MFGYRNSNKIKNNAKLFLVSCRTLKLTSKLRVTAYIQQVNVDKASKNTSHALCGKCLSQKQVGRDQTLSCWNSFSLIVNLRADRCLQPARPTCFSSSVGVLAASPTDKGVKANLLRSVSCCCASTSKAILSSNGSCRHSSLSCFIFWEYSSVVETIPSMLCLKKTFQPESFRGFLREARKKRLAFIAAVSRNPRVRFGCFPSLVKHHIGIGWADVGDLKKKLRWFGITSTQKMLKPMALLFIVLVNHPDAHL